jgi:hypothetical protein
MISATSYQLSAISYQLSAMLAISFSYSLKAES